MIKRLKPLDVDSDNFDVDELDAAVRSRWHLKDAKAKIIGLKKKFIGTKEGFKVYEVDGKWIKNNIDVGFGTGGHGLVHSYIPMDEVWVWPVEENKWSITAHEITEHNLMKEKNLKFKEAHKETNNILQKDKSLIEKLSKRKRG